MLKPIIFLLFILVLTPAWAPLTAGAELQPLSSFPNSAWAGGVVVVVCGQQYGTAWWITEEHLLTAEHVVGGLSTCTIVRGDTQSQAQVVSTNKALDAALLKVAEPQKFQDKYIFRLRVQGPVVGEDAYVIGYPAELLQLYGNVMSMSENPRIFYFKVPWYDPDIGLLEIGYTDKGNSGGPVVDAYGNAVGLVSFALKTGVQYLFFATSSAELVAWLEGKVQYDKAEGGPAPGAPGGLEKLENTFRASAYAVALALVGGLVAVVLYTRSRGSET